ncbi:cell division protein FtsQ/DivIB [Thermodesulfobacteriota bacterium]
MNIQHAANIKFKSIKGTKRGHLSGNLRSGLLIKVLIGFLLVLFAAFMTKEIYQKLCHSDFFQITTLKINGNHMVSKGQITVLSKVDIHSNLLAINMSQVKSLLESHPWIAGAEITRNWPNRLVITVKEKKPVALLSRKAGLFYLDNNGRIIAAASPTQELDFPVVTGLESFPFNTAYSDRTPDILQDAMGLLKLSARNNSILPEQNISEIHITENGSMLLYLLERAFPIYMGTDGDISTRYYRLVKVLKNLYKTREFSSVSYIRLDYQKDTVLVGKAETDSRHRG